MPVTVRYWAGARRAAGVDSELLPVATIGELRALLAARPELARVSEVASFLVDGQQAGEVAILREGAEVDVLPPFAGGAGDNARLHAVVSGQVQGVGFRDWTRQHARRLQLAGSAVNLPDGRVEIVAEGPREACESLLVALRGSAPGSVAEVEESWTDAQGATGFRLH